MAEKWRVMVTIDMTKMTKPYVFEVTSDVTISELSRLIFHAGAFGMDSAPHKLAFGKGYIQQVGTDHDLQLVLQQRRSIEAWPAS